jgi:transcriptional regulator with XRE-family HTH domain
MAPRAVPTVRRRRLAELLRQLRIEAQLSVEEAAGRLEWSQNKLYRIERAEHGVAVGDARLLLDLYDVPAAQREEVLVLVREARQRGWWQSYGDALPEPATAYVGLEQDATSLAQYSAELVPGLLQTADYARAIRRAGLLTDTDETIERWLAVRTQRQARLRGEDALTYWAVLNEAVLRRTVGSAEVMQAQLRHLIEVAELPNVTIQVLPFDAGAHAAMNISFTILRFADQAAPDVIYIENATSALYLERETEAARFTLIFDHVRVRALDPDRTLHMIAEAADRLT